MSSQPKLGTGMCRCLAMFSQEKEVGDKTYRDLNGHGDSLYKELVLFGRKNYRGA